MPWDLVERAEPELLSFDLLAAPLDRRAALALERLLARGTTIAWGALAVHTGERAADAARNLHGALARLPAAARARGILTPSCGSGRLSPAREREAAADLRDVAASIAPGAPNAAELHSPLAPPI